MEHTEYKVIQVHGHGHILRPVERNSSYIPKSTKNHTPQNPVSVPDPNYLGSGMALCGVLTPGESLTQWINKHPKND